MKYFLNTFVLVFAILTLKGQEAFKNEEGAVSYLTSQHVYVKFQSTENFKQGDTLFIKNEGKLVPALIIENLSSVSCVCKPINEKELNIEDRIFSKKNVRDKVETSSENKLKSNEEKATNTIDTTLNKPNFKQEINGYIGLASYSNFSNTSLKNSQRMRYTLSLNASNIANSRFSAESYISFRHKINEWDQVKNNLNSALKIFRLAVNYDISKTSRIIAGRKINSNISNIGAVDGLQFEKLLKKLTYGFVIGSRPDYQDYSYNAKLFQTGAFVSHKMKIKAGRMQNSLAFMQQMNAGKTDRRFIYYQHSNSLLKNMYLYSSFELDLFAVENNNPVNKLRLSGMYLSLRYRINNISLSTSYDARKNIIYYESYKSFLDQIIESETRQGYRFMVTYRPIKYMIIGVRVGYRSQKNDLQPSGNIYSYISYSNIPWLNISTTISNTLIQTSYINGKIYGVSFNRDILPGKLYSGITYRFIDYQFNYSDMPLRQNLAGISINWSVYKKLSLSINYEGTYETDRKFNRIYLNLRQRF